MTDIGADFREMHKKGDPVTLMNAWDIGSAKVLEALGAQAIATTSSGHAFTLGLPDMGYVSRDQAMAHAQDLVSAVSVPVSGDFENGYGDAPEAVAQTVRMAAEIGLAGCSIEDTKMDQPVSAYDFELALERIKAGVAAARSLSRDFVFVARADGVMNGLYDIDEAIRRIQAFDRAGADCLYVPLPKTMEDLKRVVACTDKPVNVLAVGDYAQHSRETYANLGIARISLGSGLARVIHERIISAGRKIIEQGDFTDILSAAPGRETEALLTRST